MIPHAYPTHCSTHLSWHASRSSVFADTSSEASMLPFLSPQTLLIVALKHPPRRSHHCVPCETPSRSHRLGRLLSRADLTLMASLPGALSLSSTSMLRIIGAHSKLVLSLALLVVVRSQEYPSSHYSDPPITLPTVCPLPLLTSTVQNSPNC